MRTIRQPSCPHTAFCSGRYVWDFLVTEAYEDVSTRSYLSLVQSSPMTASKGERFQRWYWATQAGLDLCIFSCTIEPFKFLRAHNQEAGVHAESAMRNALRAMIDTLRHVQHSEYQGANLFANASDSTTALPLYGNYALAGTPLEDIYGDNLPRLKNKRDDVTGLTGVWKL
ncbi:hypothetical protein F5I97DRAFT_1239226 [Phlebopus sp. FC_14]|nr:hypothetical protein F5I97DRAFT_1239226 [Phlebopus sp. FC_14]